MSSPQSYNYSLIKISDNHVIEKRGIFGYELDSNNKCIYFDTPFSTTKYCEYNNPKQYNDLLKKFFN